MIRRIVFILLPFLLLAQPDFFGYYESEVDVMRISAENYSFGYQKLRLDLEARPTNNILIGTNLNIQQYFGETTWNLLDFLPENIWQPLLQNPTPPPDYFISELPFSISDTLLIDNIYLKVAFPLWDLTLGRQQISPGTGYAWNPIDIFNKKQLLDPSYEQTGISAVRFEAPLGSVNLDYIYLPEKQEKPSSHYLQAKVPLGHFDISIHYADFYQERGGLDYYTFQPLTVLREMKLLGTSFVGELAGIGLWAEGGRFNNKAGQHIYDEYLLGLDYTFDNSFYVLFEYLHNGEGVGEQADLSVIDYLQSLDGLTHSLMRDYGFLYSSYPLTDFITVGGIGVFNFNDSSGTFNPQLDWNIFENTNLSFVTSFFYGEDNAEFGFQDWGLRVRLKAHF